MRDEGHLFGGCWCLGFKAEGSGLSGLSGVGCVGVRLRVRKGPGVGVIGDEELRVSVTLLRSAKNVCEALKDILHVSLTLSSPFSGAQIKSVDPPSQIETLQTLNPKPNLNP